MPVLCCLCAAPAACAGCPCCPVPVPPAPLCLPACLPPAPYVPVLCCCVCPPACLCSYFLPLLFLLCLLRPYPYHTGAYMPGPYIHAVLILKRTWAGRHYWPSGSGNWAAQTAWATSDKWGSRVIWGWLKDLRKQQK